MFKRIKKHLLVFLTLVMLIINFSVHAQSDELPSHESTPYDLVNAVNALRSAYGLPAYSINSILMLTAQNQADFMSSTGNVTHIGAGGSSFTDRLLAAEYPLGGNLALGGFRSENIIEGLVSMNAQSAVEAWMGDAPHQNTMLSQDLTEIGAGVSVVNGRVYYVIDCARPSTSGAPSAGTSVVEGGSIVPADEAAIYQVVQSTPNSSGAVIHEVKAGQTLWQIAIAYGVKIDDIKRLNNLLDNNIYPGNELLIKQTDSPTITTPLIATIIPEITTTTEPLATLTPTLQATQTQIPVVVTLQDNDARMVSVIAIIILAIVGGGIFTLAGNSEKGKTS